MTSLTVQGAYNRDYKTGKEMALAFVDGDDFRGTNPGLGLMGTIFSIRDLPSMGVDRLSLRYNKDRSVVIARYQDSAILLLNEATDEWEPVTPEPRTPSQQGYCRGCGKPGACAGLECVVLHYDSVVDAYCPKCGDCRSVEPDARNYSCETSDCVGKITSPFELLF